jgi:hypothetical protein
VRSSSCAQRVPWVTRGEEILIPRPCDLYRE